MWWLIPTIPTVVLVVVFFFFSYEAWHSGPYARAVLAHYGSMFAGAIGAVWLLYGLAWALAWVFG